MRPWKTAAAAALGLFAIGIPAAAATITRTIEFSAWDFAALGHGGGAFPTGPITGSATITFDPTVSTYDSTDGITLNHLDLTLDAPVAFSYYHDEDRLGIGSAPGVFHIVGYTNDFWADFAQFTSETPIFWGFVYSQNGPGINYAQARQFRISAVPEPTAWAMMITGFGMAGALLRRSRARPALEAA